MIKNERSLTDLLIENFGADPEAASLAAHLCVASYRVSKFIEIGFRQSRAVFPDGAAKTIQRQLEKLTRSQPRESALNLSGQAEFYLEQAMRMRGEEALIARVSVRNSVSRKQDRVELARACSEAAKGAIELVRRDSTRRGAPVLHHQMTLIGNWAEIFQETFGVPKSHNQGSRCRQLISLCAIFFEVETRELVDAHMESRTIKKALHEPRRFSGIGIGRRVNLPN
jgi:hypothetical protein